ncbi:hypothetical protein STAQ_35150 [Allostella sp. ATCC 35155]|nr:hypothetical protein STAQ_35150 [Stella sp. ATCC 35155]
MRALLAILMGGLIAAAAAVPVAVAADRDIGVSAIVVSRVDALGGSRDRQLRVGDRVFQNERIQTAADGRAQILFLDETSITVGPNSAVVLDTFVYDPDRGRHSVLIEATQGVLRFVSGSGDSRSFQIRTPVATVGVRGTVLDILVAPDGATTVLVVEGAADLRAIGSGRVEALDRIGFASTVATRQSAPTPPAPPSEAVRNRLKVLAPAARQLATVGDIALPSVADTRAPIDSTLPAEVIRDRLRQPSAVSSGVRTPGGGRPSDGVLNPPVAPGR